MFARFGLRSAEDAAIVRPMAFNQGFYNLFLALGIAGGLALVAAGRVRPKRPGDRPVRVRLMVGAGRRAAWRANRRFLIGAALQAVPPLVAIVAGLLLAP